MNLSGLAVIIPPLMVVIIQLTDMANGVGTTCESQYGLIGWCANLLSSDADECYDMGGDLEEVYFREPESISIAFQ
jgi:hypothetical protein